MCIHTYISRSPQRPDGSPHSPSFETLAMQSEICLQGNTDYSKQLGYDSIASQTIVILEGETVIPIRVVLN